MSNDQEHSTRFVRAELDDVDTEGHGVLEVALGLGAATVLATGAGVVAIAPEPLPWTTGGTNAAVAGISSDVRVQSAWASVTAGAAASGSVRVTGTAVGEATDRAGDVVRNPVSSATRLAPDAVGTTRDIRDPGLATADTTVDAEIVTAVDVANDATGLVDRTADAAVTTATGAADAALDPVDLSVHATIDDDGMAVTVGAAGLTGEVSIR